MIFWVITYVMTYAIEGTPNPTDSDRNDKRAQDINLADPVLISFGLDDSATRWNHLTNYTRLTTLSNLIDTKGNSTSISLVYAEKFNGARHTLGAAQTTTDFNMPESVSHQAFYGFTGGVAVLRLEGLDKNKKYDICFFGSRIGVSKKDNRETKYIVNGLNKAEVVLDVSNNTSETACAKAVQSDTNGNITITITAGGNNNHPRGFYCINAMRLTSSD